MIHSKSYSFQLNLKSCAFFRFYDIYVSQNQLPEMVVNFSDVTM